MPLRFNHDNSYDYNTDEWNNDEPFIEDTFNKPKRNKSNFFKRFVEFFKNLKAPNTEDAQTFDIIMSSMAVTFSSSLWASSASGSAIALSYILPEIDSAIMTVNKLMFPPPLDVPIGIALIMTLFLAMEIATVILQWQESKSKRNLEKIKSQGSRERIDELKHEIKLWKALTYIFTVVHWMLMMSFMTHFTVQNGDGIDFDFNNWSSPSEYLVADPFFKAPEELNLRGFFQVTLAVGLGFVISASSMILFPRLMAESIASLQKAFRRI